MKNKEETRTRKGGDKEEILKLVKFEENNIGSRLRV
jgi:hypothetical protein